MITNKQLFGTLENIHLLRKLFIRRAASSSPLHFGQVAIMRTIERNENCTQAVIAELLGVTPASVAISTKRLQKAGFITKTVDEENLRCKRLSLTDKGREAVAQQAELFSRYDAEVFRDFSDEDKQQLMVYLERIVSSMKCIGGIDDAPHTESPIELTLYLRSAMGTLLPPDSNED